MKPHLLLLLTALACATATAQTNPKISVPVQAYTEPTYKNPPMGFEVNATSFRELNRDKDSDLSWVWFGGKITNKTSREAYYVLAISFFDAKGNDLGGKTFKGSVKAQDHVIVPEERTVMKASLVNQVYTAKYLLVVK